MANTHSATDSHDWLQEIVLTLQSMRFVLDLAPKEFARISQLIELLRQHIEESVEEALLDQAHRLRMSGAYRSSQL